MEIGSKLRQARQRTGMTQEQVAREIHVSRQTISNWETGKSLPDVLSVIALSDLYLVTLDELLKGDANMLHHIEESTNAVKSRQRLGKWMETLSFLVIWAVCVAVFWLGGGEAGAMGYSILVLYWVLPLCTFVVSLVMGLDSSWKERQWWMLLYFGVGFMLVPYGTFSLANMVSTGTVHLRSGIHPYGMFYAMPGMCLGSAVRWAKTRKACPEDRRAPCGPSAWWGPQRRGAVQFALDRGCRTVSVYVPPFWGSGDCGPARGVGTFLFVAHCALGGLAALRAGWSLGGAPSGMKNAAPSRKNGCACLCLERPFCSALEWGRCWSPFPGQEACGPSAAFSGDAPAHVGHRRWIFCGSAEIFPLTTRFQVLYCLSHNCILPYQRGGGTGPVMPGNLGKAKEPCGLADQKVPIPAVYTER